MVPSSLPSIRKGTRLTDFANIDLTVVGLDQGGMGLVVWGPNQARGGRWSAAKVVRPDRSASQQLRDAFEHEALLWCRLWPHQSILQATGLTRLQGWDNLPILGLAYAPRGSLRQRLRRAHQAGSRITLETALGWGQQVAGALAYLHTPDLHHERPTPLIHADLKPENILLDTHGGAKLSDLGLSRVWVTTDEEPLAVAFPPGPGQAGPEDRTLEGADEAALIHTQRLRSLPGVPHPVRGPIVGTWPYMSPEQWDGMEAMVPASDVYALGVVLFELFAGRAGWPHQPRAPGPAGWWEAHQRGPRWRLVDQEVHALEAGPLASLEQQARPEVHLEAGYILQQVSVMVTACLEREPGARPSAEEVLQELVVLAQHVEMPPLPVGPMAETPKNEAIYYGNLALTLGNLGHREEQLRAALRAQEVEPENPQRWLQVGKALGDLGRPEEALASYEEAERRVPEEERVAQVAFLATLAFNRGTTLGKLKHHAEAVAAFQQSVQLHPGKGYAWHNLAMAYCQWARVKELEADERAALLEQALASVERALAIEPYDRQAQRLRQTILAGVDWVKENGMKDKKGGLSLGP